MNFIAKIETLRAEIRRQLMPIITKKCILTDLPYHNNLGDILIWRGEIDFIRENGIKILHNSSADTFTYPYLDTDVTIFLQGGGNFGDLYKSFHEFKKRVISHYPNNRIIMFPQSVWYEDESLISEDAKLLALHKDLYLCARDKWSYDFLKKHFSANNILLVPDMAFYINDLCLQPYRNKETGTRLFFRRTDKELTNSTPKTLTDNCDIHDWPTIEHISIRLFFLWKFMGAVRRLRFFGTKFNFINKYIDIYFDKFYRDRVVKIGCKFLAPYSHVTTTRLHAMILSILLHKQVEYIDNSTGKISAFIDTWLNDLPQVKPYE